MALLFTYDYVVHGPGFPPHYGTSFASAASGGLLKKWAPMLLRDQNPRVALNLAKATSLLHAVPDSAGKIRLITGPDQFNALVLADVVQASNAPSLDKLRRIDQGDWKSLATTKSTTKSHRIDNAGQTFGEGILTGFTLGMEDHQTWERITTTGSDVAIWIEDGFHRYGSLFSNGPPTTVDRETYHIDGPVHSGCFVAGTKIAIHGGTVPVENLSEGISVLTHADPLTYGITSDEDVRTSLGPDGETPFFSPSHIFYTVAGPRALDPDSARLENPWQDVGRLEVGHILYRISEDGKGYEHVEVESIHTEPVQELQLYGVHLREGHRSYHANGYLVGLNYPEITRKSITKLLRTFPKHERIVLLNRIHELKPLFERFGAKTLSDVLDQELRGNRTGSTCDIATPRKRRSAMPSLRRAKRAFALHRTGSFNVVNYELPILSLHEGVVCLDDEAQHRAIIESDDRTIRWTRHVPGHGYEHGFVRLHYLGLSGNGVILLSNDSEPTASSASEPGARLIQFLLAKPRSNPFGSPHKLSQLSQTSHERVAALHTNKAQRYFAANSNYIDGLDKWQLSIDRDIWAPKTDKNSASAPMPLGEVAFASYHEGQRGQSIPILTMPMLDQLCEDINKNYLAGQNHLSSLYKSYVRMASNGLQQGTIILEHVALLQDLADKPAGSSEPPKFNVSFKQKLGSSVVLPIFFRTLAVELSAGFDFARGAALEFDPSKRGGNGARHFVQDSPLENSKFALADLNYTRKISHSLSRSRLKPSIYSSGNHANPATVTGHLLEQRQTTIDDLLSIDYNSVAIHSKTQSLVQDMMQYHMNDDDRLRFLQIAKPANLPIELADNLKSDLKEWIRTKYAPAHIDLMLSRVKEKDVSWRNNFSDKQKEKIWYWWNGKVCGIFSLTDSLP
ncbi:uncharacterized protein LDX57_005345 [Aspergillus melleus]|uniref:uncharacterized protein n=1 Tax=Aspergillus melleus TaxID=138277 RepID=UPI001E8CA606|nr:uncharacterized protein LDX57_005345 [Aspergillus melleus]KAH8427634.1 hypothetical protein LDX57_005345 [Aspergillus melleus]